MGPEVMGSEGWGAQNVALFFRLPLPFSLFLSLSGGLFVVFGGVCEDRDLQMCTFGVLGLSCEAPGALKPPGLHTTAREPKRAHLRVPVFTNTTKIQREDTQ